MFSKTLCPWVVEILGLSGKEIIDYKACHGYYTYLTVLKMFQSMLLIKSSTSHIRTAQTCLKNNNTGEKIKINSLKIH